MSEINVRRADRVVTSYGATVLPKDDCDGYVLTDAESAALRAAYVRAGRYGHVVRNADGSFTGTPERPPAPPPDSPDVARLKTFLDAASGTATNAQRDDVIKSLIRVVRGLA